MSEHGNDHPSPEEIADPERVEDERVALQRELLDPSTSLERLEEIARKSKKLPAAPKQLPKSWIEEASNEELVALLKDSTTPLEVLEEIHRIAKSREQNAKRLPPKDV